MATEKKEKIVEGLQQALAKTNIGILTEYRGLPTSELNELRRKLRDARVEYKVVKNTLARIAAKNAGLAHAAESFTGPSAIALGYGDISAAAKVLTDHIRGSKSGLKITGGFLPDKKLTSKEIETLAKLPSREVLIAQVMAGIQSPIYGIVNVLAAPLRNLMGVMQARIKQLEAK